MSWDGGTVAVMSRMIFVNLPVTDLARSRAFYGALGFGINEEFSDENAVSVVISDEIVAMLLLEDYFASFATRPLAKGTTGAIVALSAETPAEVDAFVRAGLANGGSPAKEKIEFPGMYGWSVLDPDGNHWEIVYMEQPQEED